jgi:hypothetical protein
VAHLLHLCGSWKEGWSESHSRQQLTVNCSLEQCRESFNKLWPFSQPSFPGTYCLSVLSPSKLLAMNNPFNLSPWVFLELHWEKKGMVTLWELQRKSLLSDLLVPQARAPVPIVCRYNDILVLIQSWAHKR